MCIFVKEIGDILLEDFSTHLTGIEDAKGGGIIDGGSRMALVEVELAIAPQDNCDWE
jgi:hypothetical protein